MSDTLTIAGYQMIKVRMLCYTAQKKRDTKFSEQRLWLLHFNCFLNYLCFLFTNRDTLTIVLPLILYDEGVCQDTIHKKMRAEGLSVLGNLSCNLLHT